MNAGLRGHQFVKEGAEEALELDFLLARNLKLLIENSQEVRNLVLLCARRGRDLKVLEVRLVQDRNSDLSGSLLQARATELESVIKKVRVEPAVCDDRVDLLIRGGAIIAYHPQFADITDAANQD